MTVNLELSAEEWKKRFEREKTRADKLQALVEKMQAELDRWRRGGRGGGGGGGGGGSEVWVEARWWWWGEARSKVRSGEDEDAVCGAIEHMSTQVRR